MKWLSSLLAFATGAVAISPAASSRHADKSRALHRLRVVAPTASLIDGHYLSIDTNGSVGIFGHVAPDAAPRFSTASVQGSTTKFSLHVYPSSTVDHVLALVGHGGLLTLRVVVNPGIQQAPAGGGPSDPVDWESFTLGVPPSADPEPNNILSYSRSNGSWLAVQRAQNEFSVAWYDGKSSRSSALQYAHAYSFFPGTDIPTDASIILENYSRITIACEATSEQLQT